MLVTLPRPKIDLYKLIHFEVCGSVEGYPNSLNAIPVSQVTVSLEISLDKSLIEFAEFCKSLGALSLAEGQIDFVNLWMDQMFPAYTLEELNEVAAELSKLLPYPIKVIPVG